MTTLVHKSPLGPLEIPGVLGLVDPGQPFELERDDAFLLLDQGDLYDVDGGIKTLSVVELTALAKHRGVALNGATKKKDILIALGVVEEEEAGR